LANSAPPLTVAIPTCNGTAHLAATLESILTQGCDPFELVVSDDASDDGTVDLVRAHAADRARIIVNDRRLGLAGNWNQCVSLCRTPLIAIVHQDDLLLAGHLASHLRAFKSDSRIGLVCSASTVIDEQNREVQANVVERGGLDPIDRVFEPGEPVPLLAVGNPLRCSAVSIRVDAHREAGGFDPSYRYVLDWDFWLRVVRGWRMAWLATPTVAVRWHKESETHRFKTGREDLDETKRLLERLFADDRAAASLLGPMRRTADRRLARAYLNRSHDALLAGQIELARSCLGEALRLSPPVVGSIVRDPRLAVQMAALAASPRSAARWFSRGC
jgi:GT2 family glycosyltransferase